MSLNAKRVKVTGSSAGSRPQVKKDGYAKASIPDMMVPTKLGKGPGVSYSGPNVAKISKTEF